MLLACKSFTGKVLKTALEHLERSCPVGRSLQGDFPVAFVGCQCNGPRDGEFRTIQRFQVNKGGAGKSLLLTHSHL